jgi:hypothetical protein
MSIDCDELRKAFNETAVYPEGRARFHARDVYLK